MWRVCRWIVESRAVAIGLGGAIRGSVGTTNQTAGIFSVAARFFFLLAVKKCFWSSRGNSKFGTAGKGKELLFAY
jgi:hypothetical protein